MGLPAETVERVRSYWRAWEARTVLTDRVTVVMIGDERFTCAPEQLRARVEGDAPTELASLVETLGDEAERAVGEARLSYADATTLKPVATEGVITLTDDDARLAALHAASDPSEWMEASADEPCDFRCGLVDDHDALLALATVRVWDDEFGHLGVFSAAHARRHGLASKVGSAAATHALTLGLVPQWRARVGNDASTFVADRLGFVELGTQMTVRVGTRA